MMLVRVYGWRGRPLRNVACGMETNWTIKLKLNICSLNKIHTYIQTCIHTYKEVDFKHAGTHAQKRSESY